MNNTRDNSVLNPLCLIAPMVVSLTCLFVDSLTSTPVAEECDLSSSMRVATLVTVVLIAAPSILDVEVLNQAISSQTKDPTNDPCYLDRCLQLLGDSQRRHRSYVVRYYLRKVVGLSHAPTTTPSSSTTSPSNTKSALSPSNPVEYRALTNNTDHRPSPSVENLFEKRKDDCFVWSFVQRSVLAFVARYACVLSGHRAGVNTRVSETIFLLVGAVVALLTYLNALPSTTRAKRASSLLQMDACVRFAVGVYFCASARLWRHGFSHCDEAFAQKDHMYVSGANSAFTACTYCSSLVASVSSVAGSIGTSLGLCVLTVPIGISPHVAFPLALAGAVQASLAFLIFMESGVPFDTLPCLYGDHAPRSSEAKEMRRFLHINSPAGLCLYCAGAAFVCAFVVHRPTAAWYEKYEGHKRCKEFSPASKEGKRSYSPSTTYYRGTTSVAAALLAALLFAFVLVYVDVGEDNVSYAEVAPLVAIALLFLYFFVPAVVFLIDASDGKVQAFFATSEVTLTLVFVLWACVMVEIVGSIAEFTPVIRDGVHVTKDDFDGFMAALVEAFYQFHSPQWGYFTTWSLVWGNVLLFVSILMEFVFLIVQGCYCYSNTTATTAHSVVSSSTSCAQAFKDVVRVLGTSVSTCLYFCAAALLAADDGSKAQVSHSSASRAMIRFVHKHYMQVWPWIALHYGIPLQHVHSHWRAMTWLLAPLLPLLSWVFYMQTSYDTGYPDDYPEFATLQTLTSMLTCGVLPWAVSAMLSY